MTKPVRLVTMATAVPLDVRPPDEYYDASLGYSVVLTDGRLRSVIEVVPAASTMSKTRTYPGDDDDDRGREACY